MSINLNSQLIFNLDTTLRNVLKQPTVENLHLCFSFIKQCYYRRLEDEKTINDDSLYTPSILILRQFDRIQNPTIFDKLLEEFISLFEVIPICTKKVLDDFCCLLSIILTKRIMTTNDEVQQNLFIKFFHQFILTLKKHSKIFYEDFLGNFNQNLPVLGHYLSCLLQLYEKIPTLDYRINIIDTIWSLFSTNSENEYQDIPGQILACFLPGILKTFIQDMNTNHQRLIQSNLILLSYIFRLTLHLPTKTFEIKSELQGLFVQRNEQWLNMVDTNIAPLLQRLTTEHINHESLSVRRALGILMLTILCYSSTWLKLSNKIALKTLFVLITSNELMILKILLEKLFKLTRENILPAIDQSYLSYENEFIQEIFYSSTIRLPDQLLIECQTDLFQLLEQQISKLLNDRRWSLQLFYGYYTFIHEHIDFLFNMDLFVEKLFRFLINSIELNINLNLLNETSLPTEYINKNQYGSIYKYLKPDVHYEIKNILEIFLKSHEKFLDYLFEQIDQKKIINETNQKIFYLLSILSDKIQYDNYQIILSLLNQLISDENKTKPKRKKRLQK